MCVPVRPRRWLGSLAVATLLVLVPTASVGAHSELKSSDPVEGATVPSPFAGPVVLTFTEPLADGSKADLVGPGGSTVAAAFVDGQAATMTFRPASALEPGAYQAEWTSIADDGAVLRGIVKFTVAAAATLSPQPSVAPAPTPPGSAEASPAATTAAGATPAGATPAGNTTEGGSDVILPILIVLLIVAAGAVYLVRRSRSS